MGKSRLEAFSDGVIAIIITIMVLELRAPAGATFEALETVLPGLLSYLLSFVYVAIYWNNHHHLLHAARRVNGKILWANLHLLFWLSLVPFATAWMGRNHFAAAPTALYGVPMLMAAVSYWILQWTIIRSEGKDSPLARAIGREYRQDVKGMISIALYAVAVAAAFAAPWVSRLIYVGVAAIWLVPDPRLERLI